MRIFNGKLNGDSRPFELDGGGRFVVMRKDFLPRTCRRSSKEFYRSAPLKP